MLPAAVATTLAGQFAGLYLPFLQEVLPTEPVTGIDLLGVFLASALRYAAARPDRVLFRRKRAAVLPTAPGTGS
jgi:hypothetical protein